MSKKISKCLQTVTGKHRMFEHEIQHYHCVFDKGGKVKNIDYGWVTVLQCIACGLIDDRRMSEAV